MERRCLEINLFGEGGSKFLEDYGWVVNSCYEFLGKVESKNLESLSSEEKMADYNLLTVVLDHVRLTKKDILSREDGLKESEKYIRQNELSLREHKEVLSTIRNSELFLNEVINQLESHINRYKKSLGR